MNTDKDGLLEPLITSGTPVVSGPSSSRHVHHTDTEHISSTTMDYRERRERRWPYELTPPRSCCEFRRRRGDDSSKTEFYSLQTRSMTPRPFYRKESMRNSQNINTLMVRGKTPQGNTVLLDQSKPRPVSTSAKKTLTLVVNKSEYTGNYNNDKNIERKEPDIKKYLLSLNNKSFDTRKKEDKTYYITYRKNFRNSRAFLMEPIRGDIYNVPITNPKEIISSGCYLHGLPTFQETTG